MNELILLTIVLAASVYVAGPLWRKSQPEKIKGENGRLKELTERRDTLLAAIKEIEFDHQTGKVSDEDFAEINARYRSEVMTILRRMDHLSGNGNSAVKLEEQLRVLRSQRRNGGRFCVQCGQSVNATDRFCSACGLQLKTKGGGS